LLVLGSFAKFYQAELKITLGNLQLPFLSLTSTGTFGQSPSVDQDPMNPSGLSLRQWNPEVALEFGI
jgi:hypothetical protein